MKEQNWKHKHPQYTKSKLEDLSERSAKSNNQFSNPWQLWDLWYTEAQKTAKHINKIAISTCGNNYVCNNDESNDNVHNYYQPTVRMVLLKYCSEEKGFCWYSKSNSEKGIQLAQNPVAEILWYNNILQRQVRVRGTVFVLPKEDSHKYALSRPRKSQISAYISSQSTVISSREKLEKLYKDAEKKYKNVNIPVTQDWCGYSLLPVRFEFWQGRVDRLHDRICYEKKDVMWGVTRLQP